MAEALPFGIVDEDFAKYIVRFLILRNQVERGIIPDRDLLYELAKKREKGFAEKAYEKEVSDIKRNLELLLFSRGEGYQWMLPLKVLATYFENILLLYLFH